MDVSAKLTRGIRRVSVTSCMRPLGILLVGSLFSACSYQAAEYHASESMRAPGLPSVSTEQTAARSFEETTLADNRASFPAPAASRVLLDDERAPGLELMEGDDANVLMIAVPGGIQEGQYTVTRLSAPERVVVDLLNVPSASSRSFDTRDAGMVSRVRLGAHPDKSRIVMDLQGENLQHEVVLRDGRLAVVVSSEAPAATQQVFADASVSAPTVTERAPESLVLESQEAMTNERFAASSSVEAPIVTNVSIAQVSGQDNAVVAEMTMPSVYTLKRTAPSEYVLTLEGVSLESGMTNTLIAPPGSGLIRSVRPVVQGENVLLRVFVAPQTTLTARADANRIVLATANQQAAFNDMDRAQADTSVVPAPAESSTAAATSLGDEDELSSLLAETPRYTGRLISLDLQDTDIDNALRIIAEVSNLNIIASDDVTGKVTLRLIDVPWDQALDVILKTNGLDKVQEGNVVRIAPVEKLRQEREALKQARQAEEELEPLQVRYIRISYGRAAELKPLVEGVLSERGTVSYDDRTNQLIVKDIRSGIRNVAELVAKVDLRTPQVLLETQIIEARRNLLRDLGTELGFRYVRSPELGNATGYNFPNSVDVGGSLPGGAASSFPASVGAAAGSAVSMLFGSADGSRSLDARITALEQEGRVRVVSRPAVATTNNRPALIKSVEKIRVKTPAGGTSVATGQGATATAAAGIATETIEIGIQLEVVPQASPDYFVLLDVRAKSSTFGSRIVEGIPSEVERSANSTVLVSSGQTFAMGGIYKIQDGDTVSGVPFLKDVPFFGHLFRNNLIDKSDEELLFFITPRIIEGSFDDAAMRSSL